MITGRYEFTEKDKEMVFKLVEKIAGTTKIAKEKPHIFLNNLQRRLYATGSNSLEAYIRHTKEDINEYKHLVSSLTIHTTYWFRESRHLKFLESELENGRFPGKIRVLSMGCSTGEEVYSIGLVLEHFRLNHRGFDYLIEGFDIDPVSVKKGRDAIYSSDGLSRIPEKYHSKVLIGSGKTEGLLTLDPEIRRRCAFEEKNVMNFKGQLDHYDVVFCRNMLIYFNNDQISKIVNALIETAKRDAIIIVGHSEDILRFTNSLSRVTGSTYVKNTNNHSDKVILESSSSKFKDGTSRISGKKDKVDILIVDDSKTVRTQMIKLVEGAGFSFITAENADDADERLKNYDVELILLDLNMPGKSGDKWLQESRRTGLRVPCIIVTSAAEDERARVLESLGQSAQDIFVKDQLAHEKARFKERISTLIRSKQVFRYKPKNPVLVLDDDVEISEIIGELVKSQGYQVKIFNDSLKALSYLKDHEVHCVLLDHKMPGLTGAELASKVRDMKRGIPMVLISGFVGDVGILEKNGTVFRALEKPLDEEAILSVLNDAVHAKYSGELAPIDLSCLEQIDCILIGASTGGPGALQSILGGIQGSFPPIVVVQHIAKDFQVAFAESLKKSAGLDMVLVDKETPLEDETLYFADADRHIVIHDRKSKIIAAPSDDALYKGHRPCVEHLFSTGARHLKEKVLAILLTGMGDDGSEGLKKIRDAGGYAIAQNLESSVVFGMPKVAIDLGGSNAVASPAEIRQCLQHISKARRRAA